MTPLHECAAVGPEWCEACWEQRPRLLDWYCCEGGASEGYRRAGFDVYGADLFKHTNAKGKTVGFSRKRYPFPAYQGDAVRGLRMLSGGLPLPFTHKCGRVEWLTKDDFAAHAASCPCQRYSITNAARQADYPDLIGPTREALEAIGKPYVLENVEGAPLRDPILLCGRMFGLSAVDTDGIKLVMDRHRVFESNVPLTAPEHPAHGDEWVGGSYGGARRDKYEAKYVRKGGYVPSIAVQRELLGIDWMTQGGMFQSVPPAYTEFLGTQLLAHVTAGERAA